MININLKVMDGSLLSLEIDNKMKRSIVLEKIYETVKRALDVVCDEQIKILNFPSIDNLKNDDTFMLFISSFFDIDYINTWKVSQFYKIHGKTMSDIPNNIVWVNRNGLGQYEVYRWLEKEMSISFHSKDEIKKIFKEEEMTSIARDRISCFL